MRCSTRHEKHYPQHKAAVLLMRMKLCRVEWKPPNFRLVDEKTGVLTSKLFGERLCQPPPAPQKPRQSRRRPNGCFSPFSSGLIAFATAWSWRLSPAPALASPEISPHP